MTYTRVNWQDDPSTATPESADNYNVMDLGIAQAHVLVDRFDQTTMAAASDTWSLRYDAATGLWKARQDLSNDNPGIVRISRSATTYVWTAADAGRLMHFTAATGIAASIPTGLVTIADAIFPWRQYGAGVITWTSGGAGNATINSRGGALKSAGQYAEGQFTRLGTGDEYILSGDITT